MSDFKKFNENFSLEGKNTIITGGANGIGLEIAKMFSRKGSNIVVFDLAKDFSVLEKYVNEQNKEFLGFTGDVRDKKALESMVCSVTEKYKRIDILINCAGVSVLRNVEDFKEEDWDFVMDINLKAAFILSQLVGKIMTENGGGKIINIASLAGMVAIDKHIAYSCSKAALIMLTKIMALEWGKFNINSNAISPVAILTEMGEKGWTGEAAENFKRNIPVGRFGYPEEVAACALFLASEAANLINGENLVIDGGFSVK